MYCYAADMHEIQVYNILNYVKKFTVQVKSTIHYNCTMCNYCRYKGIQTLVKKLATTDFEIMALVKRCQEITHLQSKLIKEQKDIDMKLDKKIVQKCTLEKAKFAILPSIHIHPQTSEQAHPVAKITVPHSWPLVGKQNSDTWQIGDVKTIWKELFQFDDIDDNILATAASETESTLFSVK